MKKKPGERPVPETGDRFRIVYLDFQGKIVGDKLKRAIRKELDRDRKDRDRGNPIKNPYPFRFLYDDSEQFDDKYDVDVLAELHRGGVGVDRDDLVLETVAPRGFVDHRDVVGVEFDAVDTRRACLGRE